MYKQFNKDIQERIDKYIIEKNKIIFNNVLKELKQEQFVRNIFRYLLDNKMITLENYKDDICIYSHMNNNCLTILVWKEGRRIVLNTEFKKNSSLFRIDNLIKKYLINLYNNFYRIKFAKELLNWLHPINIPNFNMSSFIS